MFIHDTRKAVYIKFSLGLLLQLFLQLCYLGLQGSDGGLEPALHRTLQLSQLGSQLLVLTLQLLASVFALLCCAALRTQLCCQSVHLRDRGNRNLWEAEGQS